MDYLPKKCTDFFFLFCFFEIGSHYVAQAGLKFVILLPKRLKTGLTSVHHHAWLDKLFLV
jgi:hypothetical protein